MRKKTAVAAATVAAAAALLMGTYAWESISQLATNEKEEVLNPGARLHDDFNGINKDVYVENFTDSEDGGMDVYARVRFYEYLELGKGAGQTKDNQAVSVIDGAKRDDVSTWYLHNPYDTDDIFHSYFEWEEGGGTTYMPTFNKDKESKDADINGTLEGTTPDDEIHYDDYVDYTNPENAQKTDTAVYSDKTEEETHDVGPTLDAKVVTMSQWKRDGCPKGEFWVYDTDGWAYWADAIAPGTATGCLLTGINRLSKTANDYYYGIHVESQMVTGGEWTTDEDGYGQFGTGGTMTDDALYLMAVASGEQKKVELTQKKGITRLNPGESLTFKAKVMFGTSIVDDEKIVWSVLDNKSENTFIDQNGNLTVGKDESSSFVTIQAASEEDPELYAWYILYINVPDTYGVEVDTDDEIHERSTIAVQGRTKQFVAEVSKNGKIDSSLEVEWSLSGATKTGTSIHNVNGLLTVDASEPSGTELCITATCVDDTSVVGEYKVKVINGIEFIPYIEIGSTETTPIDGYEWYVLYKNVKNEYLIWMKDHYMTKYVEATEWTSSRIRTTLNETLYNDLAVLKNSIQLKTIVSYSDGVRYESKDKLFLLSEGDIRGTSNGGNTVAADSLTVGKPSIVKKELMDATVYYGIRDSLKNAFMGIYTGDGRFDIKSNGSRGMFTINPACWVKID